MLHSYAFSNFQSFRERTEVDLTLSRKVALTDWMAESETGDRVSKLMAVIGPNGSGKTALLKPLVFMSWFTGQSFQQPVDAGIPAAPHSAAPDEPCEFEAMATDSEGRLGRYVLRCTPQRVLHEALYQKRERFGYVFVRDWDAQSRRYTVKQQDFGLPAAEARKVRPNVSLISWAAQFGVPLATRLANQGVVSNVNVLGRVPMGDQAVLAAAEHFALHENQKTWMSRLLATWDLACLAWRLGRFPSTIHSNRAERYGFPLASIAAGVSIFSCPLPWNPAAPRVLSCSCRGCCRRWKSAGWRSSTNSRMTCIPTCWSPFWICLPTPQPTQIRRSYCLPAMQWRCST